MDLENDGEEFKLHMAAALSGVDDKLTKNDPLDMDKLKEKAVKSLEETDREDKGKISTAFNALVTQELARQMAAMQVSMDTIAKGQADIQRKMSAGPPLHQSAPLSQGSGFTAQQNPPLWQQPASFLHQPPTYLTPGRRLPSQPAIQPAGAACASAAAWRPRLISSHPRDQEESNSW